MGGTRCIIYHEENGYLISNIVIGCDMSWDICRYGRLKKLQEHHPVLFIIMTNRERL